MRKRINLTTEEMTEIIKLSTDLGFSTEFDFGVQGSAYIFDDENLSESTMKVLELLAKLRSNKTSET